MTQAAPYLKNTGIRNWYAGIVICHAYTMKSTLYLVPVPIAENALHTLPAEVITLTGRLKYYFAENARTARRLIKSLHPTMVLETLQISEIDKHAGPDKKLLREWLKAGHEIGVMSDAGCPGIADPGSILVAITHDMGAKVVPLTGPNSLILALMGSGLNGQSFSFDGYLPVKEPARGKRIKELEARSAKENQTQLFIETPYRNNNLLNDLLKHCVSHTRICIAQHLTAPNAFIATHTVADWRKSKPLLEKEPAVFLMLSA
jgi:16S rRNA (cytidine1402-2'-O)-methyltransferase